MREMATDTSNNDFRQTHDETKARFRIWDFECSPDEITKKIGLKPSQTRVKGEPVRPGARVVHKTNLWVFEDDLDALKFPEEHLKRLLELLKPNWDIFKSLASKYNAQVCLEGFHEEFHVDFRITPELLAQIADLNATLWVDLYVLTVGRDEPIRRQYFSEAVGEGSSGELLFKPKTALEILKRADRSRLVLKGLEFWKDTKGNFSSEGEWVPYAKDEYTQEEAFNDAVQRLKSPLSDGTKYVSVWLREWSKEQKHSPFLHDLGSAGIEWTKQQLDNGLAISHVARSMLPLESGRTFLSVATDEHREAVLRGHRIEHGTSNGRVIYTDDQSKLVTRAIRDLERDYGPISLIVEDEIREVVDTHLPGPIKESLYQIESWSNQKPHIVHRLDISHALSAARLNEFIGWSSGGYTLNAFILPTEALGEPPAPDKIPILTEEEINTIVQSTRAVVNSAYDGETYSLWLRGEIE